MAVMYLELEIPKFLNVPATRDNYYHLDEEKA